MDRDLVEVSFPLGPRRKTLVVEELVVALSWVTAMPAALGIWEL